MSTPVKEVSPPCVQPLKSPVSKPPLVTMFVMESRRRATQNRKAKSLRDLRAIGVSISWNYLRGVFSAISRLEVNTKMRKF